MNKAQRGFTLIEMMIVVAIIGILASMAMAAYQTYSIRAQVAEGLNLTGPLKTAITDYHLSNGAYPADNADAAVEPAAMAACSPSAKGKKASEATTDPSPREPSSPARRAASAAFSAATRQESTRLI